MFGYNKPTYLYKNTWSNVANVCRDKFEKILLLYIAISVIPTTMEDPNEEKEDLKRT